MFNSVDRGCDSCMGGSIILHHGDCRKHVFVTYYECIAAASWRLLLHSFPALELAEMSVAYFERQTTVEGIFVKMICHDEFKHLSTA